jgi:hypothetical protein
MFKDDGFLIKYENAGFYLSAGEAIVNGLYFSNNKDLLLNVPALPNTAWLDVWQERNMTGLLNRFNVVYNDGSDMSESIENGEVHRFIKLALVNSTASIEDERTNVTDRFTLYHKGNMPDASTSQSGIAQLSSLIDSESEEMAATPNAVKKVNDKVNEAIEAGESIIYGSNSNGVYYKFSSGLLICQGDLPSYSSSMVSWTFPHSFINGYFVLQTNGSAVKSLERTILGSASKANLFYEDLGDVSVTGNAHVSAIGVWK